MIAAALRKSGPSKPTARRAVHRRHDDVAEARAQRGERRAQVALGLDVAAQAEVGALHVAHALRRAR